MNKTLSHYWHEDDGVMTFEWTLLLTLVTLGIVAGVAASRDAIIDEFGDAAQAMLALDHSMTIDFPLQVIVHNNSDISSASDSSFTDALAYSDCTRADFGNQQTPVNVTDNDS